MAYIDNLLLFSEALEDHLQHLLIVLGFLRAAHLKLKPVTDDLSFNLLGVTENGEHMSTQALGKI